MPNSRSAICLVIDRLSAAYVGALGNAWIHTPAFDRLAAESNVFDRGMIDSPLVAELYGSFLTGEPAWRSASREPMSDHSVAQCCRDQSLPTVLITDDEEIARHPVSATFGEVIRVTQPEIRKQAADWQGTQLARFFAAAVEFFADRSPPALVWLHTAALGRIWDSPQAHRDRYAGEDDPPAAALIEPPSQPLVRDIDPDELLSLRHAYAGEVTVLDQCLSMLLDTIAESDWRHALLIATSCRGYPLGEHGTVGSAADHLYGELVQVPWFLRVPGGPKYGARSQSLIQPADLCATLRDWLAPDDPTATPGPWYQGRSLLHADDESLTKRMLAIARSPTGEIALSTPAWFVRAWAGDDDSPSHQSTSVQGPESATRKLELYVKPDDYHEANEVADRCLDIVDEFREVLRALEVALAQGVDPEVNMSDALTQVVTARAAT